MRVEILFPFSLWVSDMDILTYIQGRTKCSLDIINALLEITREKQRKREDTAISWKEVRTLFKQKNCNNRETIADSTLYHMYRQCREELVELGLAALVPIDRVAANVRLTPRGIKIAVITSEFTSRLAQEMQH